MPSPLLTTLYPLPHPTRTRLKSKPMHILVLGLPRSGTDSLRTALNKLGYTSIWHGFELPATRQEEGLTWCRLQEAKWNVEQRKKDGERKEKGVMGNGSANGQVGGVDECEDEDAKLLKDFDWDDLLGDVEVLMDIPPGTFWSELLTYYPNAHVIVSRRTNLDMHAWHASLLSAAKATVTGAPGWILWGLGWFDARLFWWYRCVAIWGFNWHLGNGDFGRYGLEIGIKHYENVEARLKADQRPYLDWCVTDGWEPLCEYLGKEVPRAENGEAEEFPWENRGGDEFKNKADRAILMLVLRAVGKMVVVLGGLGVTGMALWKGRP
jgi:hypothetical protein